MIADRHQLLCESCGYPIGGIDASLACPECGRPVAQSHPSRRPGSPWQRETTIAAWAATGCRVLRHPRTFWDNLRPENSQSFLLLTINAFIASLLAALALIPGPQWFPRIGYVIAFYACFFTLITALSCVEAMGIRFLGKRHAASRTRNYEFAIVCHASYAWLLSGVGVALSSQIIQYVGPTRLAAMTRPWGVSGTTAAIAIVGASFALGMVAFSLFSGLGFRALRFANRPTS